MPTTAPETTTPAVQGRWTDPRAPGVTIPADMSPWPGGPCRPADAVGDYVLMADGKFGLSNDLPGTWSAAGHKLSRRGPVIAYYDRQA